MNRKAIISTIDSKICKYIYENLKGKNSYVEGLDEFIDAIDGLANQEYESLIINFNGSKKLEKVNDSSREEVIIKSGELVINVTKRIVVHGGRNILLTPKEFDILYFLAKNKGQIYSKRQIYHGVWNDNYSFDDSNIMAHIGKLRKKIEPYPQKPIFILTVWGVGYKFNEEV